MTTHGHINIITDQGEQAKAISPVIISASRATDIPAFFSSWLFERLEKGYCKWRNPYNGKDSYVSFANTRFIVFWSKNPAPMLEYLPRLREKEIGFYIQYTLNNYGAEGLERNVPPLARRIDTFKRIVDRHGIESAVWRFDPLILTDSAYRNSSIRFKASPRNFTATQNGLCLVLQILPDIRKWEPT